MPPVELQSDTYRLRISFACGLSETPRKMRRSSLLVGSYVLKAFDFYGYFWILTWEPSFASLPSLGGDPLPATVGECRPGIRGFLNMGKLLAKNLEFPDFFGELRRPFAPALPK